MPALLRKALIVFGVAFLVVFVYAMFDPSLRDFIYALILRAYLFGLAIVVKFAFKGGVITMATIAWKRIFFVGGFALVKRFGINFAKKNAVEHVAKPLMPAARTWVAVHFEDFKEQPLWLKFSETTLGVVVIAGVGYFFGLLGYIWTMVEKVLTGKFQSFFLTVLGSITKILGFVWDKIKPWLDVILITAFIEFLERLPIVKALFHKTRRVKEKVVERKDKTIRAVVHKPVMKVAEVINNHAEKKIQKRNGRAPQC